MDKIKLAIVGCNNMGKKHLAVLREYFADKVEIVGILNSSPESSAKRAAELNVPYFKDINDINTDTVDAVIVSTPGVTHDKIGATLLSRGLSCLIEKPLATMPEGCDELISAAKKGNAVIVPGHSENYNPAVVLLKKELQSPVVKINGIRTSRNAGNKTGITAVQELMIHDLAIVYSLLGNDLKTAKIEKRQNLSWENHAIAKMEYKNGASVKLEALREDREIERYMDIEDAAGNNFHIDFTERRLLKNGKILTEGGNSLKEELGNFIGCTKREEIPMVSAKEAKEILGLCLKLEDEIKASDKLNLFLQEKKSKTL